MPFVQIHCIFLASVFNTQSSEQSGASKTTAGYILMVMMGNSKGVMKKTKNRGSKVIITKS